ncbi:SCO family protein [Paenalcaligenes niemegkensis]|uniref:SCO family protein n=1 Tax=Paenalcaligenes niemegkensis TaxID=2895469 RepID=UPI0035696B46
MQEQCSVWIKRVIAGGLLASSAMFSALALAESSLHPVRGFLPDLRFELTTAENATVTQDDFSGKIVLMFFGYASCPDICPTTMAQLSEVVNQLGDDGDKVRVLFVSVDPHRDTPEILQSYVDAFDTNAIGLTGTERNIANLARRYRVAYQIEKPKTDNIEHYDVAHSRGIYIFDDKGKAQILASDSESVERLAEAVRELL